MPLEEALAELASLKDDEHIPYTVLAKKHGCCRSTLSRRHRGVCASNEVKAEHQLLLDPHIEAEVVEYIRGLTKRWLMPTRQMIANIVAYFAAWEPSDKWVGGFLHRHSDLLKSNWDTPMEAGRHHADSYEKYVLYFDLLLSKIKEHEVEPENTYNMDEKGFMIGVIKKGKRIFDKALYGKKQYSQSSHDGNREWVTVLAAICADGTAITPCVIFPTESGKVPESWVKEINPEDPEAPSIHFATSPNGWTNHDLGMAWLRDTFDPLTRQKSRHHYRLLIADGHSSHITKPFIDYCHYHRILLFILPPHSTHTLQPLDVVCFKTLSQRYSTELTHRYLHRQGQSPINKDDFIPIFSPAWESTFTKRLIEAAFEKTGIHPPNADCVLNRFKLRTPPLPVTPPEQSEDAVVRAASGSPSYVKFKTLLRRAVRDQDWGAASAAEQKYHQVFVRDNIKSHEIEGLKEALDDSKNKKKRKRVLPLEPGDPDLQGGAFIVTPRSKARADALLERREQEAIEEEAAKAAEADQRYQNARLTESEKAEKSKVFKERVAANAAKRAAEKAESEARRASQKAAKALRDAQKSIQLPKRGKGKASAKPRSKVTKNRGGGAVRSQRVPHRSPSPPPPTKASTGRQTRPPKKLW